MTDWMTVAACTAVAVAVLVLMPRWADALRRDYWEGIEPSVRQAIIDARRGGYVEGWHEAWFTAVPDGDHPPAPDEADGG